MAPLSLAARRLGPSGQTRPRLPGSPFSPSSHTALTSVPRSYVCCVSDWNPLRCFVALSQSARERVSAIPAVRPSPVQRTVDPVASRVHFCTTSRQVLPRDRSSPDKLIARWKGLDSGRLLHDLDLPGQDGLMRPDPKTKCALRYSLLKRHPRPVTHFYTVPPHESSGQAVSPVQGSCCRNCRNYLQRDHDEVFNTSFHPMFGHVSSSGQLLTPASSGQEGQERSVHIGVPRAQPYTGPRQANSHEHSRHDSLVARLRWSDTGSLFHSPDPRTERARGHDPHMRQTSFT